MEFRNTKLDDAIAFLRAKSKELDPDGKGVNFVVKKGVETEAEISLRLSNVPLDDAVRYIVELAQAAYSVEDQTIVIHPKSAGAPAPAGDLFTEVFRVGFGGRKALTGAKTAQEVLAEAGVEFPEGASAIFNQGNLQLIMRNTRENLDGAKKWLSTVDR